LKNNINVPFSFESVNEFMFPQILQVEIGRIGCRRKGKFDDQGMSGVIEASMGGREEVGAGASRQRLNKMKKRRETELRDIAAIEMIE